MRADERCRAQRDADRGRHYDRHLRAPAVRGANSWSACLRARGGRQPVPESVYNRGEVVLPELATSYLERGDARSRERPLREWGSVAAGVFWSGWEWGGDYRSLKEFMYFLRQWRLRRSPCLS